MDGGLPSPSPFPAEGKVFVDSLGRSVRIPKRPVRIVSLAPALTETLFAVGAGGQVVGVTRYCDFPAEAKSRAIVGGFADPDPERIVALSPDLVLATADTVSRERFDALVALGVTAYAVNPRDLESVAGMIRTVGEITGHREEGSALADRFAAGAQAVGERVAGKKPRRAIFLFQTAPFIAAGPNTFLDEMIERAGGLNVAASAPTSYPRFGVEGLIVAKPDVIFISSPGGKAELEALLPNHTRQCVVQVDPNLMERPGPRLAEGLELLRHHLHDDP